MKDGIVMDVDEATPATTGTRPFAAPTTSITMRRF